MYMEINLVGGTEIKGKSSQFGTSENLHLGLFENKLF